MKMEEHLETIRRVAAEVVAEIAPSEERYFPVVWEEFLARTGTAIEARKPGVIAGLFFDEHAELKLVSALTLAVVAEIYVELRYRFDPPEEKAMREATIAAAKHMGAPDQLAAALGERIPEKFRIAHREASWNAIAEPKSQPAARGVVAGPKLPECVAWFCLPQDRLLRRVEGSEEQLQAQFTLQKPIFTIFVNCSEHFISVSSAKEPIKLEPRIQRMLVLFLLWRQKPIAPSRVVRWAWPDGSPVIGAVGKQVRSNLKVAISGLKAKLEGIKEFKIPKLRNDGNYYSQGDFTFCVLLPGWMDQKLTELGLRPPL